MGMLSLKINWLITLIMLPYAVNRTSQQKYTARVHSDEVISETCEMLLKEAYPTSERLLHYPESERLLKVLLFFYL